MKPCYCPEEGFDSSKSVKRAPCFLEVNRHQGFNQ
ncbi:hypothetical protein E2C01_099893 [Portunus trituberculatus]|uniref:Uncharacterized protein n=1 Tax=Portunus trituberculatus TaxID=210409 RepID=A0A5B7KGJ1_PORTR|nr:hypothetical protein [Portunus trituberculatus]